MVNALFPFHLKHLDEVTLHSVGASRAFQMSEHIETLERWVVGLNGDLLERMRTPP